MITAPTDNVIVYPGTKYISNVTNLIKLAAIQNNTTVHSEDLVNIQGEVISIPKSISDRLDCKGYSTKDIQAGDIAIFSFNVIHNLIQQEHEGELVYRNRLWYNAKEYFVAHIRDIYGVIRNGEIIMINGYVMVTDFPESKLYIPANQKKAKGTVKCQIMHIGNPLENEKAIEAEQGDFVYFNPLVAPKYQINNKPFRIIQQGQVLGKVENN